MKAIILSAGISSRLGNITKKIPKPMLKINNKPVLEKNIIMCKNAGIVDIYINLHYLPNVIKDYFGNGHDYGVNINYYFEPSLLGTAGALLSFVNRLDHEPFFVVYGDSFISFDLLKLVKFHKEKHSEFSIILTHQKNTKNSGLVSCNKDGKIFSFVEKPSAVDANYHLVNAGIYFISSYKIFNYIKPGLDFGYDVLPTLIKNNFKVFGMVTNAQLITIDTPSLYKNWLINKSDHKLVE